MRRRTSRRLRNVAYCFILAGLLALGYYGAAWLDSHYYQANQSRRFDEQARSAPAAPPRHPAPRPAPQEGQLVGKLEIPRIGVSVMVVEGVGSGDLRRAAGHIPGTALPGERGNIGIAAHRDTFFRPLSAIRPNDTIRLRTLAGAYRYRVISTRIVRPDDVQVLNSARRDSLTLVTCFPFNYIGAAPKRFIVRAERSPGS